MTGIFEFVRDFFLTLVLSWVGVAIEPAPQPRSEPAACTASAGSLACTARPAFDADGCDAR
jgi:hypothetical protein